MSLFAITRRYVPAALLLVALTTAAVGGCAYLDRNLRVVKPGEFYRSAQMPPHMLGEAIRTKGIRSVINLRGRHPEEEWYREESAVCQAHSVAHYDLAWSMKRLPPPESLAAFVELVETAERPILVHCQGGTHRTGVASAVFLLLEGADLKDAREQFGPFFGDAPIGNLLDLYEGSDMPFGEWSREVYPSVYESAAAAG